MSSVDTVGAGFDPRRTLANLSREELCRLGREYLLIGHLQDRVALPLATRLVGEKAQTQLSIDEWMGASPIYSARMQKALGFEGNDVGTVFKGLQLEIGAPHQFMDFHFRLDRPDSGEFWLAHCGALMDVEPFGEERVKTMCHDVEDPTFDATAAATHPCMKVRPLHRPPRPAHPGRRFPHCRWSVFIDDADPTPYEQHPNLPIMRETLLAAIPIDTPDRDREPGGWADYSGEFDPGFQLEDLGHRALVIVCQEAAVQAHLLARSLLLNVDQRHGQAAARDLGRRMWIGAAGLAAHRLKRALGLGEDIEAIATSFQLHPHFLPRTYVDFEVAVLDERSARISIGECPALQEADAHSWFEGLSVDPHPALDTIAGVMNPHARCRPAEAGDARFAWDIVIDPDAEPMQEPAELRIARISGGFEFELMQRRPLRA
jgi:hypothetical protein